MKPPYISEVITHTGPVLAVDVRIYLNHNEGFGTLGSGMADTISAPVCTGEHQEGDRGTMSRDGIQVKYISRLMLLGVRNPDLADRVCQRFINNRMVSKRH